MNKFVELLQSKRGRAALLGLLASIIYLTTGSQPDAEKMKAAEQALEDASVLMEPVTVETEFPSAATH